MQGVFGLDIGNKSVKAIEGRMSGGKFVITSLAEISLPENTIRNWEIKDEETLANFIKDLLKSAKPRPIRSRLAVLSVPEPKVFLHSMETPKTSEEKMEEIVKWELSANVSEDINEMYWDWEISKSDKGKGQVLAAAASKEILSQYEKVLAKLGIKVVAFDMESKALARAVGGQLSQTGGTLIVDISAGETSLSVYQQGLITFTSGLLVGGDKCTEEIAKDQGIDLEKAEKMKRQVDLSKPAGSGGVGTVICPTIENIASEIRRTIDFYKSKNKKESPIDKIILAGGGALMNGLDEYLQTRFDIAVAKADIPAALSKKSQELVGSQSLLYGTAIGLAKRAAETDPVTRELNLTSQSLQEAFLTRGLKKALNLLLTTTITIMLAILALSVGLLFYLRAETSRLEGRIESEALERPPEEVELSEEVTKVNLYLGAVEDITAKQHRWSALMESISAAAPANVSITRLVINADEPSRILGNAGSREQIVSFGEKLGSVAGITNVENPLSNLSTGEKDIIEFEITFDLE